MIDNKEEVEENEEEEQEEDLDWQTNIYVESTSENHFYALTTSETIAICILDKLLALIDKEYKIHISQAPECLPKQLISMEEQDTERLIEGIKEKLKYNYIPLRTVVQLEQSHKVKIATNHLLNFVRGLPLSSFVLLNTRHVLTKLEDEFLSYFLVEESDFFSFGHKTKCSKVEEMGYEHDCYLQREEPIVTKLVKNKYVAMMDFVKQFKSDFFDFGEYIVKKEYPNSFFKHAISEVEIWDMLDHEHILPLLSHYYDAENGNLILITPFKEGAGEIPDNEQDIKIYMKQLLQVLMYLFKNNIIHQNIKFDNVIFSKKEKHLYLIDFEHALIRNRDDLLPCGNKKFRAPEKNSFGDSFGRRSDIWSVGMMFFSMIFKEDICEIFNWVRFYKKYKVTKKDICNRWRNEQNQGLATDDAIDLLVELLTFNRTKRCTPMDALKHKYFQN
ncbi:hypothetical protein ABK040_004614 [Willaertia magna]